MAKNDLILLDGILEEYKKATSLKDEGEVFEYFATEQILKDYAFSDKQILSGSVDGRNDGGIDEFFILVNGHLAESIPDDFWPKSNSELEVYIMTCKHDSSFKQAPITTLIPSLIQLLDFSVPSSDLKDSYNEKLLNKRNMLISTYKRLASSLVKFDINIIYACRGDEEIESNIQAKADQSCEICQECFSDCTATFSFWGNKKLLLKYREKPNSSLDLKFEHCINQQGQYIILANLKSYYEFIVDTKGKLNKHLFDANVRDFLGLNPVNTDIATSLENVDGPNFWWLNNGITIIGSDAHIVGDAITIENVKIVNGLQTSESIYNYFSDNNPETEWRSVLVKILISNDDNTCNNIIYATNNQTSVSVPALRANDKIQCDIEAILLSSGIHYERRTNYYQNLGFSESTIISPLMLAAGYICLIYKNPFVATSIKQKFMRDNEKYEQVFNSQVDLNVWVTIATLLKKTDKFLTELKPYVSKNVNKFLKNYRQIIMFITVSRLLGTFAYGEKQLIDFNLDSFTKDEVQKSIDDLKKVNEKCFDNNKKLSSPFYSECVRYVSIAYHISNIEAIVGFNRKLWSGKKLLNSNKLSEDILNKVLNELPPQPWPVKIHQVVANKLGLKEIVVSNAIAYLIYTNRLNAQIYGFVFDSDENIIAEGEHFEHSEEEARAKLKEQQDFFERKFKF